MELNYSCIKIFKIIPNLITNDNLNDIYYSYTHENNICNRIGGLRKYYKSIKNKEVS